MRRRDVPQDVEMIRGMMKRDRKEERGEKSEKVIRNVRLGGQNDKKKQSSKHEVQGRAIIKFPPIGESKRRW